MSKFLYALLFLVFAQFNLFAEKVLIVTSAYNRPDFVEVQYKTFKKFLLDDYEFVVFNDARLKSMQRAIEKTCQKLGVRCINIPQKIHDQPYLERFPGEGFHEPSVRNANVVQYALNNLGFNHKGIVAIIDSDMFLVQPFSIKEFMSGYDIAGIAQGKLQDGHLISYLWIGIAFLDMENLPERQLINFNCGKIHGINVDAGGYTYHYLQRHPELRINYFKHLVSSSLSCQSCKNIREHYPCLHNREACQEYGLDAEQINAMHSGLENVEFYLKGNFFHYRSGSNWDQKSKNFHKTKTKIFNEYIDKILSN